MAAASRRLAFSTPTLPMKARQKAPGHAETTAWGSLPVCLQAAMMRDPLETSKFSLLPGMWMKLSQMRPRAALSESVSTLVGLSLSRQQFDRSQNWMWIGSPVHSSVLYH